MPKAPKTSASKKPTHKPSKKPSRNPNPHQRKSQHSKSKRPGKTSFAKAIPLATMATSASTKNVEAELLCYGANICATIFKVRADDIVRVYCNQEKANLKRYAKLLAWCAKEKKAYHLVSKDELEKIAKSVHHEDIAMLVRRKPPLQWSRTFISQLDGRPLIILAGVRNPHNIGSMMRVLAHYDWPFIAIEKSEGFKITPSLARMSEGGAEFVDLVEFEDAASFVRDLRAEGYQIVGTSSHSESSIYDHPMPPQIAYVLGNEVHGLDADWEALVDQNIQIPGSKKVESLNVAMACALVVAEWQRQNMARTKS